MTLLAMLFTGDAWACGGFFCDNRNPVDQAGETIVFRVFDGMVTTHVQIDYNGAAEDFAWVLPVPGEPEIFLSTVALFGALDPDTAITPVLRGRGCDADADADSDADADTDGGTGMQVEVVSMQTVGPYQTVVLRANNGEDLVNWLNANGYAVPTALADKSKPYLGGDTTFLALKLTAGATTGQLAPLGLRWPGTRASIPLVLTSVAATPDMPLTVYLLGRGRGVPLNMPHFELNPLAYDWSGVPLLTRLNQAANESGGLAFTTAYSGSPPQSATLYQEGAYRLDGLDQFRNPARWYFELGYHGFTGTPDVLEVLRIHLPAPDGVDEIDFYNNTSRYREAWNALRTTFDPRIATEDLRIRVVEARKEAQTLFDGGVTLTRLQTVLSPEEMVIDPVFGFNPGLPPVSALRQAEIDCGSSKDRLMLLPGGFDVTVPAFSDLPSWLDAQIVHVGMIVDQYSESGPGLRIADYSYELDLAGDAPDKGCGCRHADGAAPLLLGGLLLAARRRRRSWGSAPPGTGQGG